MRREGLTVVAVIAVLSGLATAGFRVASGGSHVVAASLGTVALIAATLLAVYAAFEATR